MKEIIAFANFFFHWVTFGVLWISAVLYLACATYFLVKLCPWATSGCLIGGFSSFYMAIVALEWSEYYIDRAIFLRVFR